MFTVKYFQTALLIACAFLISGAAACSSAGSNSPSATTGAATPFVMPTRDPNAVKYFQSVEEIKKIKSAFSEKAGGELKVMDFILAENYAVTKAQDPKKPENVDEYTYRDGALEKVVPVRLSGPGKLEDNLLKLDDIALEKIPDLVREAAERSKDLENPEVVLVRIAPSFRGKPEINVDVRSARKNAMLTSDGKGNIVEYKTY